MLCPRKLVAVTIYLQPSLLCNFCGGCRQVRVEPKGLVLNLFVTIKISHYKHILILLNCISCAFQYWSSNPAYTCS